ncbi:MAG TPA: hypothetical protein DEA22_07555 [Blastocatellia bacterium]|nr:hypothetical protein [Blastocatellia bacterium]
MAFESITDEKIRNLLRTRKRVTNPGTRAKIKDGNEQYNYKVLSLDDKNLVFTLYTRQNLRPGMEADFSCGLSWLAPNGQNLTLIRYNGPSHPHRNKMEGSRLNKESHIHLATERYIGANIKPEGFAEPTERYSTLNGALHCLVIDCSIDGIPTTADEPYLSDEF